VNLNEWLYRNITNITELGPQKIYWALDVCENKFFSSRQHQDRERETFPELGWQPELAFTVITICNTKQFLKFPKCCVFPSLECWTKSRNSGYYTALSEPFTVSFLSAISCIVDAAMSWRQAEGRCSVGRNMDTDFAHQADSWWHRQLSRFLVKMQ
jgi:hypothetical protein